MNRRISFFAALSLSFFENLAAQNLPQLGKASIDEVISAMTFDEKVSLLVGAGDDDNPEVPDTVTAVVGATQKLVPGAAGTTHAIPRLGIPAIVVADGPAGLRIDAHRKGTDSTFYCTHFPIATALASTWNIPLVEKVGHAIGNEAREYGVDLLLAPATNIMRNPLCGRNFEYYSEDPWVSGKTAAAMIRGIQQNGVGTSLKHFALNNQETNRVENNVLVSPQTMHELYLKPFDIAVREAKPWTIMSSYNRINGTYASENSLLLDTILRQQWGFRGTVMTDWFSGSNPVLQMQAGNDLLMPGTQKQQNSIKVGARKGEISISVLNRNVKNLLELISRTLRFKKLSYSNAPALEAHAHISRTAATEGMVLLKNENHALPIDISHIRKVAAFGITSYDFIAGGTGSGDVNRAYTISLTEGLTNAGLQLDSTLIQQYRNYIAIESTKLPPAEFGKPVQRIAEMPVSDTVIQQQAAEQDIAIITLGRISGEFADRSLKNDFYLSDTEHELVENVCIAFHAQGKQVVVILNTCGVVETVSWKNQPDAILVSWLAGQEGGNAVADILTGTASPSGKLTMTFPIKYEDVPSAPNFPIAGSTASTDSTRYEEGLFVGYRYYDTFHKPVSYPFGYGLSYTQFTYSNLDVVNEGDNIRLSCLITNAGDKEGKEVAQVYVSAPNNGQKRPLKELKTFAKTKFLQPGETEKVTFILTKSDLAQYDENTGKWKIPEGTFRLFVNSSSADCKLEGKYIQTYGIYL